MSLLPLYSIAAYAHYLQLIHQSYIWSIGSSDKDRHDALANYRRGSASALQSDASALNDGISQQTQQVLDGTGQHSLAADLTSLPRVTDNTQG